MMLQITANQLVAHMIGDYVLQSQWMASEKVGRDVPAAVHAFVYALPFLALAEPSLTAFAIMVTTHFAIDRYRLAKYLVFAKNQLAPKAYRSSWGESSRTGYRDDTPIWMSAWLLIIADNVMHVLINAAALQYF